ncbi:hypothetical protein [Mycolicibacterium chlorophenolicum]|nr:hypothetical protein [Mycolicibacterium chlorophenolicum]
MSVDVGHRDHDDHDGMQSDDATWPIPHGLSPLGVRAAEVIRSFLHDRGIQDHGGGGRFYTPEEWVDRGELYGRTSLLLVTHDGGNHAGAFNLDYEQYALHDELEKALEANGLWMELCTNWYTAVYPRP